MSLNKVFILGRLGKDPELKPVNQTQVCKMTIATSEKFGEKEQTEWHNIVVWGKLAENCARFLRKGSMALVEGKIQTRTWEKDGEKRSATEILAVNVQFVTPKQDPVIYEAVPTDKDGFSVEDIDIPF